MPAETQTVLLIGLDGFGRNHLRNLHRLAETGAAELIAGVSLSDPGPEVRGDIPVYQTLAEAREAGHRPDIVIVSTPINTHYELASQALAMGADVLVEKPPTATLQQFTDLLAEAERSGRRVQVGFQSIGSHALPAIEKLLASGRIGQLRAVAASGLWLRREAYYQRAPWAGKRVLNGVQVVDGVVTNPLAHAVKTALHIAGAKELDDVAELSCELYHAHRIEADDTSVVQLRTTAGIPVTAALTLCAPEEQDPWITIAGTEGEAILYYTRDELHIRPNRETPRDNPAQSEPEVLHFGRTNLLENLIEVRTGAAEQLLSPLADHGAYMRVLEAVRTGEDPQQIEEQHLLYADEGDQRHPIIPHIETFIARAVRAPSSYSSLGAPWAKEPATSGELAVSTDSARRVVAALRTGEDISPTDSPRPFLDEVRTLGGVIVSDQQPLDHTWHLGVGVALQDVNGNNFWGGRTYTRDAGRYIWRADHGRITTVTENLEPTEAGETLVQQLEWIDATGQPILREERTVATSPSDTSGDRATPQQAWALDFSFALTPARDEPVSLGSPGSNGRVRGGYGGFFWRLPAVEDALILTADAEGEEAVHGSLTDWLAISGEFTPLPSRHGAGGPATLLFLRGDGLGLGTARRTTDELAAGTDAASGNPDPWFVRYSGYPGIGMSLAWDTAVVTQPGETVQRSVRVLVADGRMSAEQITAWAQAARQTDTRPILDNPRRGTVR
ncbi:DUF6807 family protein [Nesterenkonia alba]|uniref:DUF6807 family protein n=1 Tax=Nesterenkonia alba TaxID=515814 RepID=UPI0003B551EA|nr:DUF6807 family protein [Nesterenkonia alba]